jgi:hypothetical protein
MESEWVYDLRGKEVVFTGNIKGYSEAELTEIALKMGASRVKDWVNKSSTDVLVRGWSPHWKYGNFGKKERPRSSMSSQKVKNRLRQEIRSAIRQNITVGKGPYT